MKWLFFLVWVFYEQGGVYIYHREFNTRSQAIAHMEVARTFTQFVFLDSVRTASETGNGCADTLEIRPGSVASWWVKREIRVLRWTPRGDSARSAWMGNGWKQSQPRPERHRR